MYCMNKYERQVLYEQVCASCIVGTSISVMYCMNKYERHVLHEQV